MNPWWSLYFIVSALLSLAGWLTLHPVWMFALAILQFPKLAGWPSRLRLFVSVVAAIALVYWQADWPSLPVLVDKIKALSGFSAGYWIELFHRVDGGKWLLWLAGSLAVYWLASTKLRMSIFALLMLGATAWLTGSQADGRDSDSTADIARDVEDYYQSEAGRQVMFGKKQEGKQDVLIVQVCSLGWADLKRFGLDKHPLWGKLDVLMPRFNSGTSYSNPAALRLLRGTCGHPRHDDLYTDAAPSCYLGQQLADAGFKTDIFMNHDGQYSDFLKETIQLGRFSNSVAHYSAPVLYHGFTGSAIMDDEVILKKWWAERSSMPDSHATYYNTISLHDGNTLDGRQSKISSVESYPIRVKRLLDGLLHLFNDMEASGKKAIVVIVGEHGAALTGNAYHLDGLRDTPAPDVTLVPAGIKLIGYNNTSRAQIPSLVSYPELTALLGNALSGNPIKAPREDDAKFMAENSGKQVFGENGSLYSRDDNEKWTRIGDWE